MANPAPAMKRIILLATIFLSVVSWNAFAVVKLPAIFGDHMVLQGNISVPVWGWAAPYEPVICCRPRQR
jgi:sialate O-acetylesterase